MWKALPEIPHYFNEYLPEDFLKEFKLLDVQTTIRNMHFPDSEQLLSMAQERIYFDRLLRIQLHALLQREEYQKIPTNDTLSNQPNFELIKEFITTLPFELTNAQKKVIKENIEALHTGKPMMRLLQ